MCFMSSFCQRKTVFFSDTTFDPVLLKTAKDLSHRKGPERTFGLRKGLIFAIFIPKNVCSRTSDIIMILISS